MTMAMGNEDLLGIESGDGLAASSSLIADLLTPILGLPAVLEDGFRMQEVPAELVITSDVFSVDPIIFPGGDIGALAACGAINDLAASGAHITECSLGVYASAGIRRGDLIHCLESFAGLISAEGARVVCGDTKVHPDTRPELILFVTALGVPWSGATYDLASTQVGDDLFVTGPLGDHSIAVLSAREGLGFDSVVASDTTPLQKPMKELASRATVHSLRDLTRGGLLAGLWDGHKATGLQWSVSEDLVPVRDRTRAAAEMLGLDVFALTNEGCMLISAPPESRSEVLGVLRQFDGTAEVTLIGSVSPGPSIGPTIRAPGQGARVLPLPQALGIPRLC